MCTCACERIGPPGMKFVFRMSSDHANNITVTSVVQSVITIDYLCIRRWFCGHGPIPYKGIFFTSTVTMYGMTPKFRCLKTARTKRIIHLLSELRVRGLLPLCSLIMYAFLQWISRSSDSSMCPGVYSASKNEYQDIPGGKDGRCVRVTTLPPSCAECLEILEP